MNHLLQLSAANTQVTPLFKDFALDWFEKTQLHLQNSQKRVVQNLLSGYLMVWFGDMNIASITQTEIRQFRTALAKVECQVGKGLSIRTINKSLLILQKAPNTAAELFGLTPLSFEIRPEKNPERIIQAFTVTEVNRILMAVSTDFEPYLIACFYTDMRNGEIEALKWKNVDFVQRQILIRETGINGHTSKIPLSLQRNIEMSAHDYAALRQQWAITDNQFEFVFVNQPDNPLTLFHLMRHVWQPLLRQIGLSHCALIQTRHTAVVLWLDEGKTPEWIALQLGIGSVEVFFRIYFSLLHRLINPLDTHFEFERPTYSVEGNATLKQTTKPANNSRRAS
ncbi:tyrosine-type recombinase/integrase [Methylomonas sp. AM2-LC]|uniref:tyrosine-type recombinase/integrase n=1 Tax=Methylomonas sp. AM2-LC TaxID=3153301 RepID=UPI0032659CB9